MKKLSFLIVMIILIGLHEASGQWTFNGDHIYNTNSGNVGIGTSSPTTLLHVQKSMTEPAITIRNMGSSGGATYTMIDDASGANWKFKATINGGFKIRDHASGLDVIVIEPGSFANAIYIKSTDNVGIGTATPASPALIDMATTTKGFIPPRMNAAQIAAISNPASGLMVYNISDNSLYIFRSSTNAWTKVSYDGPLYCGNSFAVSHTTGAVAPVNKTVTYGTVTNVPGETSKCWITSNLGADHLATAVNDATEASAGWYWQFNRQQGYKHSGATLTPTWTITSIDENSNWIATNDPCALELGSGWRLPTKTEWTNVRANGGWTNWDGPWSSALKLHAAGHLYSGNGSLQNRGVEGDYWSITKVDNYHGWFLRFFINFCDMCLYDKADGRSVRCIRE